MKKKIGELEKQKRRNRIVIKDLVKEEENMQDGVNRFLEDTFNIAKQIKEITLIGRERKRVAVVELMD